MITHHKHVIAVLWNDAHCNLLEQELKEIVHRPWQYITAGILVQESPEGVTIATDLAENGNVRTTNFIPTALIVDRWIIGPLEKKVARKPRKPKAVQGE